MLQISGLKAFQRISPAKTTLHLARFCIIIMNFGQDNKRQKRESARSGSQRQERRNRAIWARRSACEHRTLQKLHCETWQQATVLHVQNRIFAEPRFKKAILDLKRHSSLSFLFPALSMKVLAYRAPLD